MRILLLAMLLFLCGIANATNYYISPTGNDANPGTLAQPFKTINKLNAVLNAGDTAFFRGGTYRSTQGNGGGTHFSINNLTGTATAPIVMMAYPGELPIFNLDDIIPTNSNPFAMVTSNCRYVKLKGFVVKNLRQVADGSGVSRGFMFQNADNCTVELFDIFNIGGTGFTLDHSDDNLILNCDSHNNGDGASPDSWNFGDGFTCTGGDPSSGNTFRGCRTWMNGDDGWDFFAWAGTKVTIQNCWSFWNSIKPWGPTNTQPNESQMTPPDTSLFMGTSASQQVYQVSQSSGEGFKLGGFNVGGPGPAGMPTTLKKYLDHCLSFQNQGTGFSANMLAEYSHQMSLLNCIAYSNGNDGFGFGVGRSINIAQIFRNNWSFNNNRIEAGADWVYDGLPDNISNNYWGSVYQGVNYGNLKGTVTLNNADFAGLTSAGATSARQADGSLPNLNYLKLISSSDLIDKGMNVSLPFLGSAPDLGAFEYSSTTSTNQAPNANAGVDKTITLPTTSVALAGSGTDTDGTIVAYQWTKISGPTSVTIAGLSLAATTATALVQGIYKFELKVTDNGGLTDTDTMQVTVNAAINLAPTANAGVDQTIILPIIIANLSGSGSDPDGTISSYRWTKVSGPSGGIVTLLTSALTTVTGLLQGSYKFELQVTDNNGATDTDTMTITVNSLLNQAPTANAGVDQIITLPTNSVSMNGSGNDPDGNIASYQWVKISGPTSGTITSTASPATTITGLVQGVYQFRLTVTDNNGTTDTDIMQVTVNAAANVAPTANAGINQSITLPTNNVTVSGSGTDTDGTIASYQWAKISGPASGTITNPGSATTTITALVQGVYQFQLTVTDNSGATATDIMQVTVNAAANVTPTANAGINQSITLPTNNVTVNGSGTDTDGTIASYLWTKISGPASGTITNASSATTTITALVQGIYQFQLTVTDNSGATATDIMQVTVNAAVNMAPNANAGSDQSITLPINTVAMNGSGTDTDGTIASYQWTKISGPASGTINNATSATTNITGLTQGVYQFQLTVTDNSGATDTDIMQVTVNAAVNLAPTANAGADKVITLPTNNTSLTGSGTDIDGSITAYRWRKISGPASFNIANTNAAATNVTGMAEGIYQFELRVTDNNGAYGRDTMQVTVNPTPNVAPAANAGLDKTITLPTNSTSLSGSGTDPDGNIASYQWVKISGPASGTISNATSATTTITALTEGIYQFELTVTDNDGATDTDIMQVTVNAAVNQAPTAEAGSNQSITLPINNTSLNGSGTDPDGTITIYAWIQVSGPSTATITNATTAAPSVTGLIQGIYQFQLTVTDNSGATDTDIMQVTVNAAPPPPNQSPVANAGLDQIITLPTNSVSLTGTGTDPDGTITSYRWRKISGPTSFNIGSTTAANTTVTALVLGVYKFELRVTDNNGATGWDTMQVTVNPALNVAPTANAGLDKTITLPTNSTSLNGSGTDTDGTITAYLWRKISGPTSGTITNTAAATTTITALVQGVYKFELKVTDNSGATDLDTIQVTVNAAPNQLPTAEAGVNQTITLPTNSTTLVGAGVDPDGTITAYAWVKISGPSGGTVTNGSSATTNVTGLIVGVYQFQLTVMDNSGATATDIMQVNVNPAPNQGPTANAGLDKQITLPTNTVSLTGSGTDPDGTITTYLWRKISGPASGTITNTAAATTTVTGLTQGVYLYELKVTDNSGAADLDTMQVTVNPAPNVGPAANAGLDQNITLPTNTVSLSGSGTDPDGTITTYLWRKISGPANGTITNIASAATSVTGLVQGVYKFELKATDNSGATDVDTMQVNVNAAVNQGPVANAGLDQNITLPASTASLNGSGTDPDGTITAYLWRKISGPTNGTITNTASATTTVTGLVQGVYKFELKVTDNSGATDVDTMQVTVNAAVVNQLPTANAGLDQNITLPTNTISLSGSGTDPDGTITAYLWRKISGPTNGSIVNTAAAGTSVSGLVQGVYKFELKVTDNSGATDVDTMQVNVNAAVNQPPTSNAGIDVSITLPTNLVSLNGSGTDPDGTITAYLWRKISGPTNGTISNTISATSSVTGLVQGVYKFELKVTDNSGATDVDTMQVTVNPALNQGPTANAGLDKIITLPTSSTSLNGSGTDPDGTIAAYLWRQITGPANGTITNTTTATTTVTGLVQGVYKFELKVTDNSGATDLDTMQVTVNVAANLPPTANAGLDQNITLPTNSASLNGSGTDPDGTIAAYLWRKISGPANGTITNTASATTTATGLEQGVYKFELKVTDNSGATDTDTMQVTVNAVPPPPTNLPPVANAGSDTSIYLPEDALVLAGSGTDPDGTIVSYSWSIVSGAAHTLTNANDATANLSNLQQGIYEFELTVTDNDGATATDTIKITVGAGRLRPADVDDVTILGNPVSGTILNVKLNSYYLNRQVIISLFDVNGEKLLQKEVMITQHVQLEKLDISRFQKGNYFLKVNFAPKTAIVKKVLRM